ncbi:MAG: CehA/McbA family metallohydrolase [Phycisphaerales bacterium]|nr:MAG: CehA/McbA family metallohydrolase [Phycisphaerales bacterium]
MSATRRVENGARGVRGLAAVAFLCLWQSGAATAGERSTGDEPDPQPRVVLPDESGYSASARDGRGSVTVSPEVIPVRTPVTMTFVYTAADSGIAVGGGVICNVSNFWGWTPPQSQRPDAPGYVTVRCSAEEVPLEVQVDSGSNVVAILVREQPLRGGQTVTVVYGDTSGGRHPTAQGISDRYAERGERFFFKVDGDGDGWFAPLRRQARFRVEARQAAKLVVFGPSWSRVGEGFDLTVAALDASNNLVESFTGKVRLTPSGVSAGGMRTVVFKPDDRGAVRLRVTPEAPGILRVAAADAAGVLAPAVSNPIVVSQGADTKYALYWADLHGHCNVCDGTGSPEDYYRYARDVARLDAVVLTDHDHWGYVPLDEDPATWRRLCELSRSWYEPGRFVTFCGYEWTNWTFGHKHVLFLHDAQAAVFAWQDERSDRPDELWGLLAGRDCLTIPHHPGGHPMPTFWKYHDPRYEPVVEIASVHGVSEHVAHPRCISSPVESGMVQSALERGYELGIIGSGDTHDGHPGIGSPGARAGLAGIYAASLTREAVFDALRARRVYATTGCRAILRFHMGDTPMGGVAHVAGPDVRRTLSLTVLGDAPISAAAIVKNNREAAVEPGGGLMLSWEWTDPEPAKSGDFYYARIVQSDGEWIWSSPIWVRVGGRARSRPAAD